MTIRIFISHAAADETLASALVDSLMASLVLDEQEVRCTSVPGHKLPVGSETATTLRDELSDSAVVLGLLTPSAVNSGWVLFELGAAWGAGKNLMPLLGGGLAFKGLPGPLSGHHAVRLTDKSGLIQVIEEIAARTGASKRTGTKIDVAINKLVEVAVQYDKASAKASPRTRAVPEPIFAGIPFSELIQILGAEKVTIPAGVAGQQQSMQRSLFEMLILNHGLLCDGIQSNQDTNGAGGFFYREVGLRLMPYELVKFDKLTAAQAKHFKRIVLSSEGQKFVAHYKRLTNANEASQPSKKSTKS